MDVEMKIWLDGICEAITTILRGIGERDPIRDPIRDGDEYHAIRDDGDGGIPANHVAPNRGVYGGSSTGRPRPHRARHPPHHRRARAA